jgi:hypothetical protein
MGGARFSGPKSRIFSFKPPAPSRSRGRDSLCGTVRLIFVRGKHAETINHGVNPTDPLSDLSRI